MNKRIVALCAVAIITITSAITSVVTGFILSSKAAGNDGRTLHAYYFLGGILPSGHSWQSAVENGILTYSTTRLRYISGVTAYNIPIVDGVCNGMYPNENTSLESLALSITFHPDYADFFSKVSYDETEVTHTRVGFTHTFTPTYALMVATRNKGTSTFENYGNYNSTVFINFKQGEVPITHSVIFCDKDGLELDKKETLHNTAVDYPLEPSQKGYKFDGWYTDASYTTRFEFDTLITGETRIYAKWIVDDGSSGSGDNISPKWWGLIIAILIIFIATPICIYIAPKRRKSNEVKT